MLIFFSLYKKFLVAKLIQFSLKNTYFCKGNKEKNETRINYLQQFIKKKRKI
jgi:hypothetical protein